MVKKKYVGCILWILAAVFYFYEFLIRVSPSVMLFQLTQTFNANAAALGTMSAFYLYAYSIMQLPVGLMMDRFGSGRLLAIATVICGIGCLIFAFVTSIWILSLGRIFMGAGSAFAYIGLVYLSGHWFPNSLPFMIGIGTSIGMLGAIGGETIVAFAVKFWGWRGTAFTLGILALLLALLIWGAIKFFGVESVRQPTKVRKRIRPALHNLKTVCKNSQSWIIALISLCLYASTAAFAGLWAPPFLHIAYGMAEEMAGIFSSAFFLGWIIGGPLISYLAMVVDRRKPFLIASSILGFIFISIVIYVPHLPLPLLFIMLMAIGIFSAPQTLTFSLALELNEEWVKGTAAAFTNFMAMLGGSIVQSLVGLLLDLSEGPSSGIFVFYSPSSFRFALSVFPLIYIFGLLLCFFLKPRNAVKKGAPAKA